MGDVTKLPKWAQARISKLEMDVDYYKKQAFAVTTSEKEQLPISNTEVGQGIGEPSKYLPPDSHIRFHGTRGWMDVTVEKGGIRVRADDIMKMKAQSSNSFYLEVEAW